ncbi:hypothetical protein F7232_03280 [Corynebacterium sp. 319]|uniref:hypothetical protein n=1 Tax=unclassified Corynebacterium TaxID=2624378 RepID=UPI00125CC770|nr:MULTISPECIES: hypothetical protein [unclassified Corynebacterium]KAB1552770.1 hypothetical protein F7233_03305 [Corynebacterium sp. 321]KAB1554012.1 hypothetical protein F7232_03280 [Corynebacterium sp. 319]KAB3540245.1 hypothetical protein F8390_03050 [Corynebacterium sp. 366]
MTYDPNQGQWGPQQPVYGPPGGYYGQPQGNQGNGTTVAWVVAAIAVTALLVIGGVVGYNALSNKNINNTTNQGQMAVQTSSAPAPSTSSQSSNSAAAQEAQPAPAPQAEAPVISSGYNHYDYNGVTSSGFANNVYWAWKNNYSATGNKYATLSVYSPYTGYTYRMSCYPSGSAVRCTGGKNALVSIY